MTPPACRLYLITPPDLADLAAFVRSAADALGADDVGAFQLRLKDASEEAIAAAVHALKPLTRSGDVPLILNDRPDLAARLDCDGVHIGQEDGPYAQARRLLGDERIVGVTCHDSRHLAMEAAEAGADYVAFGAFFPTRTKTPKTQATFEVLEVWQETMTVPCVAIGGITAENARAVAAAGADFVAVSSGVWDHADGPAAAVVAINAQIALGLADRSSAR